MPTICSKGAAFVYAEATGAEALGFIEATLRHDYVNGTESSPVAFIEGLLVAPAARNRGIARALVNAVEGWGRACGCTEIASDTEIENSDSQSMHRALGFEETERVVYFRKKLTLASTAQMTDAVE